jgi:hypothetical protein
MTVLVQEFLKSHSLAKLKAEYGIKSSAKPGDRMFSLNYDQVESKAGPMVNQCRGLILGTQEPLTEAQVEQQEPVGETVILARPFDRFFNLGDVNAAPVDMEDKDTIFFEKLDGTLCIVWFDSLVTKKWQVATRAVPLADKPMTGWGDMTFRKLFEKALADTLFNSGMIGKDVDPSVAFEAWTSNLNKGDTYCFELTTPLNRIVVHYSDYRVHLLSIRRNSDGQELPIEFGMFRGWVPGVEPCLNHNINNLQELLDFVGSKPPFEQEGIVVRDKHFNRVKVKSLAYMAYNKVRDSTANSPRAVMELILTEKLDDVLPVLEPHIQDKAREMQEQTRRLFQQIENDYQEINQAIWDVPEAQKRKMFAMEVQERGSWMAPLIDRFLGRSKDLTDYIQKKKNPDGSYPDGLLDMLVNEVKQFSE